MKSDRELIEEGYRRISRRYGRVARTDRKDWPYHQHQIDVEERLQGFVLHEAEQYCRCTTTDKIELGKGGADKIPPIFPCWGDRPQPTDPFVVGLIQALLKAMRDYCRGETMKEAQS